MKKFCVICGNLITERIPKGKAVTCNQKCAGILAWRSREEKNCNQNDDLCDDSQK